MPVNEWGQGQATTGRIVEAQQIQREAITGIPVTARRPRHVSYPPPFEEFFPPLQEPELPMPPASLLNRVPHFSEYRFPNRDNITYGQHDGIFPQEPSTPINNLGLRQWTHFAASPDHSRPEELLRDITTSMIDRIWRANMAFHAVSHPDEEPINNKTPLFGIELEVECREVKDRGGLFTAIPKSSPMFLITKHDGSLDHSRGIELCSVPATHLAHYRGWEPFFKEHAKKVFSYTSPRCGMHIHVRRSAWRNETLWAFSDFLNQPPLQTYLTRIAGRPITTSETYSLGKKNPRDYHNYAKQFPKAGLIPQDRYAVVNTVPRATIEVRMFRGNADSRGFFKNLDFVTALLYYCDEYVVEQGGYNAESTPPSSAKFLDWVTSSERKHLYPALNEWMRLHFNHIKKEAK